MRELTLSDQLDKAIEIIGTVHYLKGITGFLRGFSAKYDVIKNDKKVKRDRTKKTATRVS
jgi:hypothetical protein